MSENEMEIIEKVLMNYLSEDLTSQILEDIEAAVEAQEGRETGGAR